MGASVLMAIGIAAFAVAAIVSIARFVPGVIPPVVATAALAPTSCSVHPGAG